MIPNPVLSAGKSLNVEQRKLLWDIKKERERGGWIYISEFNISLLASVKDRFRNRFKMRRKDRIWPAEYYKEWCTSLSRASQPRIEHRAVRSARPELDCDVVYVLMSGTWRSMSAGLLRLKDLWRRKRRRWRKKKMKPRKTWRRWGGEGANRCEECLEAVMLGLDGNLFLTSKGALQDHTTPSSSEEKEDLNLCSYMCISSRSHGLTLPRDTDREGSFLSFPNDFSLPFFPQRTFWLSKWSREGGEV